MRDVLAHTRPMFSRERVVAGPTHFFAISRFNLAIGPIRDNQEDAEADADSMCRTANTLPAAILGWGALP